MTFLGRAALLFSLLSVLPSCEREQPAGKSSDEAALQALQRSVEWLTANPPNPADAKLGEIGTDAWSWAQIAKLHPSAAVRRHAKQEARKRLGQLEPAIELTPVELSYWAVLLRSMNEVGIDTSPHLAALSEPDLSQALKEMSPTTALWTSGLLRFAGITIELDPAATEVATGAAASDWTPTVRSAYAIFHEIAAVTDLGRVEPRVFNERQLDFVRHALPQLLRVCIAAQDSDAVGEVLIAAAILDQRDRRYYVDGMRWLLAQQQSDGTYRSGRDGERTSEPSSFRHIVLIGSWAVLESLQTPPISETAVRPTAAPAIPDSLPYGLLLAFSQFGVVDGKATSKPGPARFDILTREDGEWRTEVVEDTQSNIFHKAMPFRQRGHPSGIISSYGTGAYVKLWHRTKCKIRPTTLWHAEFGGKFNRIRDMEVADLDGDGASEIVVGTHDQGVVAILRQRPHHKWNVEQVYKRKDTFVHEIEVGDVDGDGVLEAYASLTPPNRFLEAGQGADVVRFVPKRKEPPAIVAALGERDIKEIYVGDVDGDGLDELYVSVEALMTGFTANAAMVEPLKIRRYDADTPPDGGIVIATIPDQSARFLTVGDVDGDGNEEMVVASFSKGLWLLRPGKNPKSEWGIENIDHGSGGYEHAARFADLDGDGIDELYVADDKQGELRRYVWVNDRPKRVVIQKREVWRSRMTWNIVELERASLSP